MVVFCFSCVCVLCTISTPPALITRVTVTVVDCFVAQYDDIPVEVSGHDLPEPMLAFDAAVLGAALMHNLSLARYEKPTPVQKYSIPIGTSRRSSCLRSRLYLCVFVRLYAALSVCDCFFCESVCGGACVYYY